MGWIAGGTGQCSDMTKVDVGASYLCYTNGSYSNCDKVKVALLTIAMVEQRDCEGYLLKLQFIYSCRIMASPCRKDNEMDATDYQQG